MQALKILLLLIFCCTTGLLDAQTYFDKVKCDSFVVMQDTSKAIIYRKNKTTVYDKTQGKFRMRPTKDAILYIRDQDILVKIEKDRIEFIFFQEGNRTSTIANENPNYSFAEFPLISNSTLDSLMLFNAAYLNYKNGSVATDEMIKDFEPNSTYSVQRLPEELLVIHNTSKPASHFDLEIEQFVYDDGGVEASGIYDLGLRQWIVPAIYQSINLVGNKVFALKSAPFVQGIDDPMAPMNVSYDYYEINEAKVTLMQENMTGNNEIDLAYLFNVDSVENRFSEMNIVTNQYITFKDGKQGLIEFQLFTAYDYNSMGPGCFRYDEILPAKYDYILNDILGGNIITLLSDSVQPISLYRRTEDPETFEFSMKKIVSAERELIYGSNILQTADVGIPEEYVLVDGHLYYWPELIVAPGFETPHQPEKTIKFDGVLMGQSKSCGLQFYNDSLLHVIDFESDVEDLFASPLQSIINPYEDSIMIGEDGDLYAAYPGPEPGYEKSGLFNVNSSKWFIERNYKMIHKRANGMLIQEVNRNEFDLYDSERYSLLQFDRTYVFQNIRDEQGLKAHKEALFGQKLPVTYFEYPNKSIYRENYGYEEGFYRYVGDYYAVVLASGDWQVQQPIIGIDFNLLPLTKPAEFVHYNPSYRYYFWLDQDSIYLEIGGSLYGTDRENGKINLDIIDLEDNEEWRIHLISGKDTIVHTSYMFYQTERYTTASFHVEADLLFVNEPQEYDNITPNAVYLDGYWEGELGGITRFKTFETETSYICKLEEGVWKKVTPYYAAIQTLPFGYLVSTGYEEEIVDPENYIIEKRSGSFLVLDSSFKAISYLDFFDFSNAYLHEFGLQLCTDKCFLVGNDGKIITTANWDDFLLEDGQIKALRYKPMEEDEYWDFENELEIEAFKFYPLPKQ